MQSPNRQYKLTGLCSMFAWNIAALFFDPGLHHHQPVRYCFSWCLDCNRTLCVCWPGLIFPQQRLCAEMQQRKKTNRVEETCLSIQGSALLRSTEWGLLCGWRKRHIPLKWVSLGWKPLWELPRWPTTPSVFVQGEPWSWALCLPARILGSLVGVARQAHHSAPGCFAFGVKRAPSDEPAMS